MAKKKSGKKSSKAAADTDITILLPPDAWKEFVEIRDNTSMNGEAVRSIITSVLGSDSLFGITGVTVAEKKDYAAGPDSYEISPKKC